MAENDRPKEYSLGAGGVEELDKILTAPLSDAAKNPAKAAGKDLGGYCITITAKGKEFSGRITKGEETVAELSGSFNTFNGRTGQTHLKVISEDKALMDALRQVKAVEAKVPEAKKRIAH